jgi:hypothetical protein
LVPAPGRTELQPGFPLLSAKKKKERKKNKRKKPQNEAQVWGTGLVRAKWYSEEF